MGFGQAVEWHRMNGSIAMFGNVVKPGYEIPDANVIDIAPTLLYLLGMPVDSKMPGRVLLDALDEEWVRGRTVAYTSVYDSVFTPSDAAVGPSPGDKALKDKLVSLGYVAGGQTSLVNLANFYHKSGKYAEAIEIYKQILEEKPDDRDAKIGMGNAYLKIGGGETGVRMLEEILEESPDNLEAIHSLANHYVDLGEGDRALELAELALRVDAGHGESHFIKGIALQRLGRRQEAVDALKKAMKLAPDMAEIYGNLAMLYVEGGRPAEAVEMVEKALDLSPGRADMVYIKGVALSATGDGRGALDQFKRATGIDPSYVPAYLGAAGVYFTLGELDSVLAVCARALERPSDYSAYVHDLRGNAYLMMGRNENALDEFRSAIDADPDLPGPRMNLARAYASQGRKGEAEKELKALLARHPGHSEAGQLLRSLTGSSP
jgi:tetratricopeptide (TPR) repeat protein